MASVLASLQFPSASGHRLSGQPTIYGRKAHSDSGFDPGFEAVMGEVGAPAWLETDGLLAQFGARRARAVAAYERFVHEGREGESIWRHLNRQVFLGDDAFVAGVHQRAGRWQDDINISRAQRRPPTQPLDAIAKAHPDRDTAMQAAWAAGEYSDTQIAAQFGVHFTTVGRIVRRAV